MKIEHSQTIWFCRDNFLWPCFEKIWLLYKYAWSIIIFMSTLKFCLESFGSEHSCKIYKITLRIMLDSIPHQKFCFYHLPTRGRVGIIGHTSNSVIISIRKRTFTCKYTILEIFCDCQPHQNIMCQNCWRWTRKTT